MPTPQPATACLPEDPALLRIEGAIATITLNRPEAFNSVNLAIAPSIRSSAVSSEREDVAGCGVGMVKPSFQAEHLNSTSNGVTIPVGVVQNTLSPHGEEALLRRLEP